MSSPIPEPAAPKTAAPVTGNPRRLFPRASPQTAVQTFPQFAAPLADKAETDSIRKIAFFAALAMLFVRFGVIPELLVSIMGVNTYLLYIVSPPVILGLFLTGGFGRAFRSKAVWFWTLFFCWMLLATPTSSWIGASVDKDLSYGRTDLICLYAVAGLVVTWKELKGLLNSVAMAGLVVLLATRLFAKPDDNGRIWLDLGSDGTISNSNDLAAHMVLLLPFFLYWMMKPGRNNLLRVGLVGCVIYGVWIILGTSSRGAMLGLVAMALLLFFRASGAQKVAIVVSVPILAIGMLAILPKANLERLGTIFAGGQDAQKDADSDEAGESVESRQYLFWQSVKFTMQHPLFGIGPSQFSNYEGGEAKARGEHGNWHETHNTYTQISSECGVPALIFALLALGSAYRLVNKTYKLAKKQANKEVAAVCLCYLTSLTGYLVCFTFLAGAYRFTLPAMVGIAVAIYNCGQRELAKPLAVAA